MKTLLALALLLTAPLFAVASEDRPFPWQAITLEFGYGLSDDLDKGHVYEGTVRIATRDGRVTDLTLQWSETTFTVPATEFASVPGAQLETLKILRGQFYGDVEGNAPYVVVEFRFGEPTLGEYSRAGFLFYSGRYKQLHITSRTSANSWETAVKNPGEKIFHGHATELLLPDTTQTTSSPKPPGADKPK